MSLVHRYIVYCVAVIIGVVAGAIVLKDPDNARWRQGLGVTDPAKEAHDDCVERYRQGFRKTKAGC